MTPSDHSGPSRSDKAQDDADPSVQPRTAPVAQLHVWQVQAVRDVLFVAAVVGLVWVGYALRTVTVPLLVALLLAYLFEPLVAWMCRHWGIRRPIAVGAILATGGVIVLAVLALVVPLLIGQTIQFIDYIQNGDLRTDINGFVDEHVPVPSQAHFQRIIEILPGNPVRASEAPASDGPGSESIGSEGSSTNPDNQTRPLTKDHIDQMIDQRLEVKLRTGELGAAQARDQDQSFQWLNIVKGTTDAIVQVIGAIVRFGLLAFLIPFYFFFFSLWYADVVAFADGLVPTKNRKRTLGLLSKMDRVVAGFVRGRIVISLMMGALLAIGWWLCGVPYAIMLGLVVGVFCAVPYLGVIGIPLAVGLLLFDQLGMKDPEFRVGLDHEITLTNRVISPDLRQRFKSHDIDLSDRASVAMEEKGNSWQIVDDNQTFTVMKGEGRLDIYDSDRWAWWAIVLWPTLVFVLVQLIEGYALTPLIAGKVTNLDPVTIIVAVLAGGSVLGVYGMLLAIPLAACIKILATEVMLPKIHAWTRGEITDPLPIERD